MSTPRPNTTAQLPPRPASRRGYRALVVALAAFLAVLTLLREPFRGYLAEVTIAGHAGDEIDLAAARRWLAASSGSMNVQLVTSPIYPGDCEIRLARLGPQSAAAKSELDAVARRFLEHYLPEQQAIRRQATINRLQIEFQAARDAEDALRIRSEELRSRQISELAQARTEPGPRAPQTPSIDDLPDPRQQELRRRLAELRLELSRLLAGFTDEHPQVISLRAQISHLENELGSASRLDAGPELGPSARFLPGRDRASTTQLVSTSSLVPLGPQIDLAAELEQVAAELAAATRTRQWAERQLQQAALRNQSRDVLLTWSAAPARVVGRSGGTPKLLTLAAACLVALLGGGLMFHTAGRVLSQPLIDSAEQLAAIVPLPVVGQTPLAARPSTAHLARKFAPYAVRSTTLAAEMLIVGLAVACLVAILADPSLATQVGADPFGTLSEIVGRMVG
jgi:hypothetical protein